MRKKNCHIIRCNYFKLSWNNYGILDLMLLNLFIFWFLNFDISIRNGQIACYLFISGTFLY